MGVIGAALAPYKLWAYGLLAVALIGAGALAGNATRAHWDAGDIAKAQAATTQANADRDAWRFAAGEWKRAIGLQNKANAQAQAEAAHDAALAVQSIEHAAAAEQDYKRRQREIEAQAARDRADPKCRAELERPVCGVPLE